MRLRLLLSALALMNGAWMIADGTYVLRTGRYIGSEIGPWRHAVKAVGLDPLRMGWIFVALGIVWLTEIPLLLRGHPAAFWWGVVAATVTLWYASIGSVLSILFLLGLVLLRERFRG